MKRPTAREVSEVIISLIAATSNAVNDWLDPDTRLAEDDRAHDLAQKLRSMADAVDRANADDWK